jgi:hypothetical protein
LRRNFNPSGEQTVGAWFTASVLLGCGLLLFAIAAQTRRTGGRYAGHWWALGAIFVFLSVDDAVALHEQLGDWIGARVATGGPLLWAWVIPYAAFAAAVAVAYVPFLRDLPADSRRRFLRAGALYVGGALVLEMVQAAITDARGRGGGPVSVLAIVEEAAELLGAILFLHALLVHLAEHVPIRFAVEASRSSGDAGPPLDREELHVVPVGVAAAEVGQPALEQDAVRGDVLGVGDGDDPLQAESVETVGDERPRQLGRVPTPPAVAPDVVPDLDLRSTVQRQEFAAADQLAGVALGDGPKAVAVPLRVERDDPS